MPRRLAVSLAAALALIPCAAASAATRYASPTGLSVMPCLQLAPCSLEKALQIAGSGDTVQLGAGTYGSPGSSGLTDLTDGTKGLTIAGAPGPAPVIWNRRAVLIKPGSKFSNLDLRMGAGSSQPNLLLLLDGTSADRISARHLGPATNANPCRLDGTVTLTNSVCEVRRTDSADVDAVNMGGTAVVNPVVTLHNVTAIANAPDGTAIAGYATSNDLTVNGTNVIATGGGHSVETVIGNQKTLLVNLDNSDLPDLTTTVNAGGGG